MTSTRDEEQPDTPTNDPKQDLEKFFLDLPERLENSERAAKEAASEKTSSTAEHHDWGTNLPVVLDFTILYQLNIEALEKGIILKAAQFKAKAEAKPDPRDGQDGQYGEANKRSWKELVLLLQEHCEFSST